MLAYCHIKCKRLSLFSCLFLYSFVQVLFLNVFSTLNTPCVTLLRTLQILNAELKKLSHDLPELFHQSTPDDWNEKQENVVLRTWDVESKHNYDNNMHLMTVRCYYDGWLDTEVVCQCIFGCGGKFILFPGRRSEVFLR